VESISRKRAALKNLTVSDQINDFAHAQPLKLVDPLRGLQVDEDLWTSRVRSLSAVFADYPSIKSSSVEMEAGAGTYYVVNSEGTEVREAEGTSYLRVRAIAQAADGMSVRDAATFHSLDVVRLPLDAELRRQAVQLAENVTALAKAPRGEDYTGPVLFEGVAGAQIFAEVLGRNLVLARRPVMEPGRPGAMQTSELEGRQGARILPEWMDVVDDPSQTEWRGRPLFGSYKVDREGVPAGPLRLIEKGVLKSFPMTRQPVRGIEGSNGRARMPGGFGAQSAAISNLFVSASESMPVSELKKQLIEMIRSRNKPYAVIVRKMDFPSSASFEEVRRLIAGSQGGASRPVSMPILIYKVFADGREELMRGVRLRGLNARSLKDIVAAGDDPTMFEFMENGAPFALMGAGSFVAETCVVAPSILIDDLELHPLQDELPKLPVAPAPDMVH
jgi:predicted Zn-dependent protease